MAQQDTGLGWSAKEEWLMQTASTVAEISEVSGGYELPMIPGATWTDIMNNGPWGYYRPRYHDGVKLVGEQPYIFGFAWNDGTYLRPMAVAYGANKTVRTAISWGDISSTVNLSTPVTDRPNWYYGSASNSAQLSQNPTTDLPIVSASSAQDAAALVVDGISISTDTITKTNPGYTVACLTKWKTTNGTELISPILISSDSSFTEMSGASGYNFAQFNKLLSGVRFYMGFWDIPATATVTSLTYNVDLTSLGNIDLERLFMTLVSTDQAHVIIINSPDPYEEQTGGSEEEGGDGDDIVDDDVDFTPLPSSMAVASGFITLFCPSQYELNQLANYMWGPLFDVDTFKKLFANPMDCILGLAVYPFPISASGTKTVSVGGIATTVNMGYTLQQYHIVDCGSVYVPKQWGAYMDYAPYTKFNIFLPYIGFRPISADDIMGKTISLRYMVDILSGACNAELKCGSTVLYSWAGSCAAQIPITGNDWRSAITAGISIAGSVAATVLTQGASAPMIAGTVASATVNSMQLKPEVQRSGSISGSSGFLAGQRPYLVRTNPRSAIPANQNKYSGYPSFVTILLGSLTGYNEVYSVHLENIPATSAELEEIESILKGGAIF